MAPQPKQKPDGVSTDLLQRMVRLLHEQEAEGMTKVELARDLGQVTTRTVDRAFASLRTEGAVIREGRKGLVKVFILEKGPAWDDAVSADAMVALRLASLSLEQAGTAPWSDLLERFQAQAVKHLSSRERQLFETLRARIAVQGSTSDPVLMEPRVLKDLLTAMGHPLRPREVEIDYRSSLDRESKRRPVAPFCLNHDAFSGGAFLLGWDLGRNKPVHFRLNRIDAVTVTERTALFGDQKALEQARDYQIGGWFGEGQPFPVEVRIHGAAWAKALLEAPPALPGIEVYVEDGKGLVRFKATEPKGPARWILQFGGQAEVIGPDPVREEVRKNLLQALAHYPA